MPFDDSAPTETRPTRDRTAADFAAEARRLANGYAVLVGPIFCLIVLGALVRAHEAGLACPDWPLCFGELVPRMDVKVAFEWSHRLLAGSVSLLFVALGYATLRRGPLRRVTARPLAVAAGLLVVQVLLGALTVWHLLAAWTVTSHLVTGNAFALTVLWIANTLRDFARGDPERAPVGGPARGAIAAAALLLFVQVVLGGLVSSRFAGLACPEWPACNGGVFFPSWRGTVGVHLLHRWNAVVLLAVLGLAAVACRRAPALRRLAGAALVLGLCQTGVGIANVLTGIPVELTGLHSALAAALVLTLSVEVREVTRAARRERPTGAT